MYTKKKQIELCLKGKHLIFLQETTPASHTIDIRRLKFRPTKKRNFDPNENNPLYGSLYALTDVICNNMDLTASNSCHGI